MKHLSRLERYFLLRCLRKTIQQGDQDRKIKALFCLLMRAARREYYEDNLVTLDTFMQELLQEACSMTGYREVDTED